MRYWTVIAVAALLMGGATAAEKPWPAKGDTVYVSARLTMVLSFLFDHEESEVPECVPLKVMKAWPDKARWRVNQDGAPRIAYMRLEGPWPERLHSERSACQATFAEEGQPTIIRRSYVHTLIPDAPED